MLKSGRRCLCVSFVFTLLFFAVVLLGDKNNELFRYELLVQLSCITMVASLVLSIAAKDTMTTRAAVASLVVYIFIFLSSGTTSSGSERGSAVWGEGHGSNRKESTGEN